MASSIQRLADTVINQIAAGEVIERPASVVKELVENSLDAGATRVDILLEDGGKECLALTDDGHGMSAADMVLAVERHTTSKLAETTDLERLSTYGFRGEALASIASVAELELTSRPRQAPQAYRWEIAYGVPKGEPRPVGAPVGTTLTVRRLFGELPARRKFLRSGATEFSHCAHVVRELALASPQVKFFLRHGGRSVHEYVNPTREGRFREAIRPAWEPLVLTETQGDMSLEAYLSPSHLIQSRGELSLFINGRPVRNRSLLAAVRNAYLDTLGPQHDPSGALYLDIRKDWVDVNVHPQKLEVRCLRQEALFGWLRAAIRKAIATTPTIREVVTYAPPPPAPRLSEPSWDFAPAPRPLFEDPAPRPAPPRVPAPVQTVAVPTARRLRYLGQVKASYLLCEDPEGIVVVDQHALHEKLKFEELRARHRDGNTPVQRLLVPLVLTGLKALEPVLEEHERLLAGMGFEVESFGNGDVAVKSRPELLPESRVEGTLREILERLREDGGESGEVMDRALHKILATVACHAVVRAGQTLSPTEAERLLAGLDRLEEGWTCPHGRPVVLRLGYPLIEKHFERI